MYHKVLPSSTFVMNFIERYLLVKRTLRVSLLIYLYSGWTVLTNTSFLFGPISILHVRFQGIGNTFYSFVDKKWGDLQIYEQVLLLTLKIFLRGIKLFTTRSIAKQKHHCGLQEWNVGNDTLTVMTKRFGTKQERCIG